jgi:hypothetical protein
MGRQLCGAAAVSAAGPSCKACPQASDGKSKRITAVIFMLAGTACILAGLCMLLDSVIHAYDNFEGKPVKATVTISSVSPQTDTEYYENAQTQVLRYHLIGTYVASSGDSSSIILNESYLDSDEAMSMLMQERVVTLDSATGSEAGVNKINMFFSVFVCAGFILYIISGIVIIGRS